MSDAPPLHVAIACGGTGGHLFPGAAVGAKLLEMGCEVTLLVSEKEVDRRAILGMGWTAPSVALPAVGLSRNLPRFAWSAWKALRAASRCFNRKRPDALLAMGGFTSAPAAIAARRTGAAVLLHDSNAIPGRANRWLAPWIDGAMIGFSEAGGRLRCRSVSVTGTPVRPSIGRLHQVAARRELGFDPSRPVVLFTGGSQGSSALNRLAPSVFRELSQEDPEIQFAHLCGTKDEAEARRAAAALGAPCRVEPFTDRIELWLGAASAAVSRAGASSLAEFAAARLPAVLIPYPHAADNHQWANACIFAEAGAAEVCAESAAAGPDLARRLLRFIHDGETRGRMVAALAGLDRPNAASSIADLVLNAGRNRRSSATARAGGRPAPRFDATEKGCALP
jgi:UDP-N-acetylglucosamine--N-acetylmuramyl-(pentapeptide) pyrophosphoryl-undecaprenol N-acetylglucosamine transferase